MDATTHPTPQTAIRLLGAGIFVLITVLLGRSVLGGASADSLHTLGLLAVALCAYAWVLYPAGVSVVCSGLVLVSLAWAWAARQAGVLALDITALLALAVVAGGQRRFRAMRTLRMQQKVDDLGEERTVKEQAVAAAVQTREALQRKLARYTQLQTIAEELSNLTDASAIAQLTVERAFELIGKSDVCLLFLVDHERQELSLYASRRREAVPSIRAKHGDQFDRHVLRTHRPLLVNDVRRDFRFTITVSPERDISSVIACPLMLGQRPSGVLRLDSPAPAAYTQDDLRFLDILLDLVSAAMTNARLFAQTQQLAVTDGLTGLTLRRPFLEQLPRELARAARSREAVSLLMVDVDHFKSYNGAFGHTAGDVIL
jgi:putative methionine-R-sulfoxide reductase with GAF domain